MLYADALRHPPALPPGVRQDVPALTVSTAGLAAAVAAASVLLALVPGRLLGTARRGRWVLLAALLLPLLLPEYAMHYAWSLLFAPASAMGRWLVAQPGRAQTAATVMAVGSVTLWYWPLAALLIAAGWRRLDPDELDEARLEAGPVARWLGVTLPLLARAIGLAFAVTFVLAMSQFGAFHLAGVRTVGTELAVLYEQTGSAAAVARAAWPLAALALLAAVALWRGSEDWSTQPPVDAPAPPPGRWRWALVAALLGVSVAMPVALLATSFDEPARLADLWRLHRDDLASSARIALAAGLLSLAMAGGALAARRLGRVGRAASAAMQVALLLGVLLPGSLVAAGLLEFATAVSPRTLRSSWVLVSLGLSARLAGVVLIMLRLAQDSADRHLAEMAATDGAGPLRIAAEVHWPRVWPLPVGAVLLVAMLGMTELPASLLLLPAGVPHFAQRLLNQLHYARDQQVIASLLALVLAYAALALAAAGLLALVRRRRAAAVLVAACALACLAGCDGDRAPGGARVLAMIGRTGSGQGEFLYPRAIDLAGDGTFFVVDKTGRVQHLAADGAHLGTFRMPEIAAGKPVGLTVGPDGNVYVADTHYYRVVVYAPDGRLVRQWGRYGEGDGEFIFPTDVAFGPDGRVYVSEYGGHDRISVFEPDGRFVFSFGEAGRAAGQLSRPAALCADLPRGRLYVADACNHRIAVYDFAGNRLGAFGRLGEGPGELRYPYGLSLLPDGTVAVCEFGNNRVQIFDPGTGRSVAVVGRAGRAEGELAYPWAVAVDGDRRAYVVDAGNDRVQVWQL